MGAGPDEDDRHRKEHLLAESEGTELGVVLRTAFSPSAATGPNYLHTHRGKDHSSFHRYSRNIILTIVQADAIANYSHIFRRSEGLFLTLPNEDKIEELFLEETRGRDIDLFVVTDAEAILGIGDQGVGVSSLILLPRNDIDRKYREFGCVHAYIHSTQII